jgi:ribosome-binding protein aMBF1 (putative translation factor)
MRTHDQIVKKLMSRPDVRKEVERIEREEFELLDLLLKARHEAGLSQAQVAERMGTKASAIARLERSLVTGKHSPSIMTLRKYANACGRKIVFNVA